MSSSATAINLQQMRANGASFSPTVYQTVDIQTTTTKSLRAVLDPNRPFDKGSEPGSAWYVDRSPYHLIRTKAIQEHSSLLYRKGESITPLSPWAFDDPKLTDGDILLTKDSNVGECAIVNGVEWQNHMFSGGIVRLHPTIDRLYLFAFLKHPTFKAQVLARVPRGVTIAHAKTLWMDCLIPFPDQNDADLVMRYVAALMRAIIDKEVEIGRRDAGILAAVSSELERNQASDKPFEFAFPRISEIRSIGRMDASIYGREFKEKIHRVSSYRHGTDTPTGMGMTVTPGPSLEIKLLGTRIDSAVYKEGFYRLILPTNISEYGTMKLMQYMGTRRELPLLRTGDIVIGEAGFQKGRSIVLIEPIENCTTNAHGLIARRDDGDLTQSIFFRCIFNWFRANGLIDLIAVGGSGGHLSPSYFDQFLLIPRFPKPLQRQIAALYSNENSPPSESPSVESFAAWHKKWNQGLGIWQLDREMRSLQSTLRRVQTDIMHGRRVTIPIPHGANATSSAH